MNRDIRARGVSVDASELSKETIIKDQNRMRHFLSIGVDFIGIKEFWKGSAVCVFIKKKRHD